MDAKTIVVIDDDPTFRRLAEHWGPRHGLKVKTCSSVEELARLGNPDSFDLLVVDYFIDNASFSLTGVELARALEGVPMILISNSDYCVNNQETWPLSVRGFYPKRIGIDRILRAANLLSGKKGKG